jgi:hypothetical protein
VRDRGPRTRRSQYAPTEPVERTRRPPARVNGWQALAILALIAATAGWTTAIVLATRPAEVAQNAPAETDDAIPSDDLTDSIPPAADSHDAPELEPLLPTKLKDTPLQAQSWTGDTILTDDGWSNSINAFLAAQEKKPSDMHVAQVFDPNQAFDGSVGIYRVAGIPADKMKDALIAAWKVDFPDAPSSTIKVDGKDVTKVDFGEDALDSYLFVRGDDVFDIETSDQSVVAEALVSLPPPGSTARPQTSASSAPAPSTSAPPSASGG